MPDLPMTLENVSLEILPDGDPVNPRDWDHLGTMACWHQRYQLGDAHDYPDPPAFEEEIHAGNAVILPLYLFDHSGLTMRTECTLFRALDMAGWDWGQVGYIYVTLVDLRREYGVRRVSRRLRARGEGHLRDEVAAYDQYLRGEVYGYVLKDRVTGEVLDACWGFFGSDPRENGMADYWPGEYRDVLLSRCDLVAA